jgi:hypothetical protein
MERKNSPAYTQKRRRRMTLLYMAIVAAIVIALLAMEQIALLYVLATLSVAALLIVVALSDLKGTERGREPAPFDDAAAIADGQTASTATLNTIRKRSGKRR